MVEKGGKAVDCGHQHSISSPSIVLDLINKQKTSNVRDAARPTRSKIMALVEQRVLRLPDMAITFAVKCLF